MGVIPPAIEKGKSDTSARHHRMPLIRLHFRGTAAAIGLPFVTL